MKKNEMERNLKTIAEMVTEAFNEKPMLLSSAQLLIDIRTIALNGKPNSEKQPATEIVDEIALSGEALEHVILSCDASIKKNPGGPSSVGYVIRFPGDRKQKLMTASRRTPATTNNQAEYDAVYEGLIALFNLVNNPGCKVEVRSDSQLVVKQLNGDIKCQKEDLIKRRDIILELVKALPVPIEFTWRPRNSTRDLKQANYLAQDLLGVSRH